MRIKSGEPLWARRADWGWRSALRPSTVGAGRRGQPATWQLTCFLYLVFIPWEHGSSPNSRVFLRQRQRSLPFPSLWSWKNYTCFHLSITTLLKLGTTSCPLIPLKTNFSTTSEKEEAGERVCAVFPRSPNSMKRSQRTAKEMRQQEKAVCFSISGQYLTFLEAS